MKKNKITIQKSFKTLSIIGFSFSMLFSSISMAQPNNLGTNSTLSTVDSSEINKILNLNLEQQHYYVFEENVNKFYTNFNDKSAYLIQKIPTGHPIIFWMLADMYSKQILSSQYVVSDKNLISFTKQMLYTALIMTEQDINMCIDNYAKNGPRLLKTKYSSVIDFERRYISGNKEAFKLATDFIARIQNRPNAEWGCFLFGDKNFPDVYGKTYPVGDRAFLQKQTIDKMVKLME